MQRTAGKTKDFGGYFGPKMASEATLDHLIQKKFRHTPDPLTRHSHACTCRTVQASPSHTLSHPFHKEGWGVDGDYICSPISNVFAIVETYGTTRSTRTGMHMMATKYIRSLLAHTTCDSTK